MFNEQQLQAIQTKNNNILVSASAGSGKTTVLVERLMNLILYDRIPVSSILAMTFTDAAASEMKKRLAAQLQIAYQKAENEEDRAYVRKQLTGIQTAHISTIHSFFLSIVQEYYYMIGLDPVRINNILDNGSVVLLQQKALRDAFDKQYTSKDVVFIELCQMFSPRPENNDALANAITTLAALATSKPDPDGWLISLCDGYQNIRHIDELPKDIYESFFDYLQVEFGRLHEALSQMQHLYEYRYYEEEKKAVIVRQKIAALPQAKQALQSKDYESFRLTMQNIAHAVVPTSPDKEDEEYTSLRKEILDLEDHILALMFRETTFVDDIRKQYPYVKKLIEMCQDYRNNYARMKECKQGIDFDDMEHFALEILQANSGYVADIYRKKFTEIMVDEFQDSNDVQDSLISLICRENNVFRVGDIKQSIYGFRHAKPQLMKSIMERNGPYDKVIYLSHNYRSKKMIVDFNNILFDHLMNTAGFSCSYDENDNVETGITDQKEDNVPICFHAIFHNEINEKNDLILSKNDFKASYIAAKILEIRDQEKRRWKDFVVLVRSNARKADMKAAFDELHIPYFIDVKSGFYQSNAVQIILSALKALLHPREDISFVALMMSPLFQRSAKDIAQAKIEMNRIKEESGAYLSYYDYFVQHPFDGFSQFEELRRYSERASLVEMLNALYAHNDYYARFTSIQEKTNLDLLFDQAVDFENKNAMGIAAFLKQIALIQDAQTAEAIPVDSDADVVRVMSIHQSKGLQFPVVFLWSTDRMIPMEFKDFAIFDSDMGIGMKNIDLPERYVRTTVPRIAIEHKKDKEELEEEMRILYVATTRPQQQLHIVDCINSLAPYKKPLTTAGIYNRNGYTSWILQTFLNLDQKLFTLREIHDLWDMIPCDVQSVKNQKLPLYEKPVHYIQLSTPSGKETAAAPSFQKKRSDGRIYGQQMHKMVEVLSQKQHVDEEMIRNTANQLNLSLRMYDIQSLLSLYAHPLFQKALEGEFYHEYPFAVKTGSEILHGFMDFISFQDDRITIIDFKTDHLQEESEFLDRYEAQLHAYGEAMKILYPEHDIQLYIYSFYKKEMIQI